MTKASRGVLYGRDARALRRQAEAIIQQIDHYERNGAGDESRFGLIEVYALRLVRLARRPWRRYEREREV